MLFEMSFRIDDILKRGTPSPPRCATYDPYSHTSINCDYRVPLLERSAQDSDSILQQTLLSRTHFYNRQNSEAFSPSKCYDSLYNSAKLYLPYSSYPDPYTEKGKT